jgi:hypothetical protein
LVVRHILLFFELGFEGYELLFVGVEVGGGGVVVVLEFGEL